MLLEGHHWRHFPGADHSTLAVFYVPALPEPYDPAGGKPPQLPYFKRTAGLKCGRLLVNPLTNNFYQDCVEHLAKIIARVSATYDRTIHYGYSQGATGALDQGLRDPKCTAIFAVSPHLVLDRPFTRSAELIDPDILASARPLLMERLSADISREVHLFISVFDAHDGGQVRDALALPDRVHRHFLREGHYLGSVNAPEKIIEAYLAMGAYRLPTEAPVGTDADIRLAALTYDVMVMAHDSAAELAPALVRALECADTTYGAYWLARYLDARGDQPRALVQYQRALGANAATGPEVMVCMGNAFAQMGRYEMALGCYRQVLSEWPDNAVARQCEASLLASLNRT